MLPVCVAMMGLHLLRGAAISDPMVGYGRYFELYCRIAVSWLCPTVEWPVGATGPASVLYDMRLMIGVLT